MGRVIEKTKLVKGKKKSTMYVTSYAKDYRKSQNPSKYYRATMRPLSPTRRQNPHPMGLTYQAPYQSDFETRRLGNTYSMWPHKKYQHQYKEKANHIAYTNWHC